MDQNDANCGGFFCLAESLLATAMMQFAQVKGLPQ